MLVSRLIRRSAPLFCPLFWLLVGAAAAALVALGRNPLTLALPHAVTEYNVNLPAVVDQIRDLDRLETASAHIEKIVEARQRYSPLPGWMAGDRVLLAAQGEVVAGVDLSRLGARDVQVDRDLVHVRLPHAQLFSVRLDDNSFVYDHSPSFFTGVDRDLESEARSKAQTEIRTAALGTRLLQRADENARARVVSLLHLAGVRKVTVDSA